MEDCGANTARFQFPHRRHEPVRHDQLDLHLVQPAPGRYRERPRAANERHYPFRCWITLRHHETAAIEPQRLNEHRTSKFLRHPERCPDLHLRRTTHRAKRIL